MRLSSTTRVLLIALGVVVAASFLPLGVSGYILGLLTIAYYFGVFAMAWDLLFGFAGEVNFGPTFLIGTGAYTAGILDNLYRPPIAICVAAGALAAVAGGVVLALPALPQRGPDFGLTAVGAFIDITVGVQIIIAVVIGGRRTILGAVLGSIFIIAMSEALRPVGDLANFIVFAMALVVVLTFPNGFFGLLTRTKETS